VLNAVSYADVAGNVDGFVFLSFTTGGVEDGESPTVEAISPGEGAAGVPVNARVVARLSEPIDPISVGDTSIELTPFAPGTVTLAEDGRTVIFTPGAPHLAAAIEYTVRVSGIRDLVGQLMVPFTSVFTTSQAATPDVEGPLAVVNPVGIDVPVTSAITVKFNEPIVADRADEASVPVFAFAPSFGFVQLAATYSLDATRTVLTILPAAPLPGGAVIQVFVNNNGALTDLAGNAVSFVLGGFTTANATDVEAPVVTAVTPADGATEIGPNAAVVLTFSEPLNPATVTGSTIALFSGADYLGGPTSLSGDNRTVMISRGLPFGSVMTVMVTSGIRDLAGNEAAGFSSTFTTRAADDAERPGGPSIVTQRPGSGATGVPAGTTVTLFANERLNPATIPGALHVSQNGVLVAGRIAVTAGGQAIEFIPDAPFLPDALVQVFLDATAEDLAGNRLFNYGGLFTVEADPTVTAPMLLRVSPVFDPAGLPRNVVVELEFNEPLDPATVVEPVVRLEDALQRVVASTITLRRGGRVIRLVPIAPLDAGANYAVVVAPGQLRDLQGAAYAPFFAHVFTIGFE